jgi:hypothetical protein
MATILDGDLLKIIKHFRATVGKCLAMMAFEKAPSGNNRETSSPSCRLQLRSTSEGMGVSAFASLSGLPPRACPISARPPSRKMVVMRSRPICLT